MPRSSPVRIRASALQLPKRSAAGAAAAVNYHDQTQPAEELAERAAEFVLNNLV